jgi:hypothetical protein
MGFSSLPSFVAEDPRRDARRLPRPHRPRRADGRSGMSASARLRRRRPGSLQPRALAGRRDLPAGSVGLSKMLPEDSRSRADTDLPLPYAPGITEVGYRGRHSSHPRRQLAAASSRRSGGCCSAGCGGQSPPGPRTGRSPPASQIGEWSIRRERRRRPKAVAQRPASRLVQPHPRKPFRSHSLNPLLFQSRQGPDPSISGPCWRSSDPREMPRSPPFSIGRRDPLCRREAGASSGQHSCGPSRTDSGERTRPDSQL